MFGPQKGKRVWLLLFSCVFLIGVAWLGNSLKHNDLFISYWYRFSERPLQFGLVGGVANLDPIKMSQSGEWKIGCNIYEGLIQYDPKTLEPKPGLADSWEITEHARVFTFHLRENVKFLSGRTITAQDIKYAWERALQPGISSPNQNLLFPIYGATEMAAGRIADLVGVQVIDEGELRVTLTQPNVAFLSRLGMPVFWVVDREVVGLEGEKFGLPGAASAGTGAFRLQDWEANKAISITRNPDYWGPQSRLSQVLFQHTDPQKGLQDFSEGRLDFLEEIPTSEFKNLLVHPVLNQNLTQTTLLDNYYYQFNLQDPTWGSSALLRQAVNYAIDRTALIDSIFGGVGLPLTSFIPSGVFDYPLRSNPYSYDPQKAADLLAQAGYPQGQGLPALVLTYNDLEAHGKIAQGLQEQLAKIGVNVVLEPIPWSTYQPALASGKFVCFRSGWNWEYPDPDDLFFFNFHSTQIGKSNYSFYHNPQIDDFLSQARLETQNRRQRLEYYHEVEKQVAKDAPWLELFSWEKVSLVGPKVYNLHVTPLDWVQLQRVGIIE